MGKVTEIGAFEAKTRLGELLREVERGKSFVIRRRGKVVARLMPPAGQKEGLGVRETLSGFHAIRKRIKGPIKVRELVEEGRRY